jgi:hypothetical protein
MEKPGALAFRSMLEGNPGIVAKLKRYVRNLEQQEKININNN